ncbi:MAG TPA: methyltransferase domain-containing protein [Acidimicrobiia bacterium]|nr:methyltransferase domain-containing protein [Acidimicrobiia bacterium]
MGKQSRRKRERQPGEAKVHRYLARAGLPDQPDPGPYRRLAAADPEWFDQVVVADDSSLLLSRKRDADPGAILAATRTRYGLLYRDLDTALAEYASRPVMIAAAWLRWWFRYHPPATRLLDIGCGPGVLTCAYGLALPEAEVVGIDAAPEAVACAEELAARLGVHNVSFVPGDFLDPAVGGNGFDQVVAVTALADAGLYPQDPPAGSDALSSVADVDGPGPEFRSPAADRLVGRLSPGGSLLVLDRTPDPSQAVRLGAALLHAGLDLDLSRAGVELFVEGGQPTTFTRFAGVRSEAPATPDTTLPGDALAAWIKSVPPPAFGPEWHDELRFEALKADGARLVWGCELDYAPTLERREIWEHDGKVYGWITTTGCFRELTAGRSPEELWNEYGAYAGRCAAKGVQVRFHHPA